MLGHLPSRREAALLGRLTLVMGNRNQLQWDLPALDSFELNRAIYRIPRGEFVAMRDELIELLDIGGFGNAPVRNLSLGERMKMEIAGSLLHRPAVLFDGNLSALSALSVEFAATKTIIVRFDIGDRAVLDLSRYGEVVSTDGDTASLHVPRDEVADITARPLADHSVSDLTIKDPRSTM